MAKKKKEQRQEAVTTSAVVFPHLSPKIDLECRVTLEDQIILLDVSIKSDFNISLMLALALEPRLIDLVGTFHSNGM